MICQWTNMQCIDEPAPCQDCPVEVAYKAGEKNGLGIVTSLINFIKKQVPADTEYVCRSGCPHKIHDLLATLEEKFR